MQAFSVKDGLCQGCGTNPSKDYEKCMDKDCAMKISSPNWLWDDKFGWMFSEEPSKILEGVGADAEIVTNERGGKQSKSPMAMHLLDPNFLIDFAKNKAEELEYEDEGESTCVDGEDIDKYRCYRAMEFIGNFMLLGDKMFLQYAMDELNCEELQQIISIAKVLQYGASRYKANNWRLIPQEEHINHALIHIIAHLAGDRQDEHIDHALCRLMMAYATKKSDDFDYGSYVEKKVA